MASALLDALGWIGESLDKPGRATRGLLAGRPEELMNLIPFSDTFGLTDPSRSVSGRGLLEQYGMLAPKGEDEGFGWGDIAGMGVEAALDPTNLIGGGALKRLLGSRRIANASNEMRLRNMMFNKPVEELLAKGAMPEEVARMTKAVDEAGKPLAVYHGTPHAFDMYDPAKMDPEGLFGPAPGGYHTDSPALGSEYAVNRAKGLTRPFDFTDPAEVSRAARGAMREEGVKWNNTLNKIRDMEAWDEFKPQLGQARGNIARLRNITDPASTLATNPRLQEELSMAYNAFGDQPWLGNPNVRKEFLDIRNPFDIDRRFTPEESEAFVRSVFGLPNKADLLPFASGLNPQVRTGQEAYNLLGKMAGARELDTYKDKVNQAIQALGYDAIKHTGGAVTGGVPHQVYIALDPSQVYKPLVAPALRHVPDFMTAPRISPLLAALGLENVLARGSNQI